MKLRLGVFFFMGALGCTTLTCSAQSAKRYVLTGGPGVGKSTLIKELALRGYQTVPEIYAVLYEQAVQNNALQAFFADLVKLYDNLLNEQLKWESQLDDEASVFLDRSAIDIIAFGQYFKVPLSQEFCTQAKQEYDRVFFLEPLAEHLYESHHRRKETPQEAAQLHNLIKKVYRDCGYQESQLIDVPFGTVQERVQLILDNLLLD